MAAWAVERRLDYIDWLLTRRGWVQRDDLAQMFGVSVSKATQDLRAYEAAYPDAIAYDHRSMRYVRPSGAASQRGMDRPEIAQAMRLLCAAGSPMGFPDPAP